MKYKATGDTLKKPTKRSKFNQKPRTYKYKYRVFQKELYNFESV